MRRVFIVNPHSNGGATRRTLEAFRRIVSTRLGAAEFVLTERPGHARELSARLALDGVDRLVAVGGDGTFSEVVDGVVSSGVPAGAVALGLVHQGTGGDFRRSLGLEHRLDRYLDTLERDRRMSVDVGRLTTSDDDGQPHVRHIVNVASVGMGGLVAKDVQAPSRLLGGSARYLASSLKALVEGNALRLRVRATTDEGEETFEVTTRVLALCNGRFFGGGMELSPRGLLDDGHFDLLWVEGDSRLPVLSVLGAVYSGTHLRQASMRTRTFRAVEVTVVGGGSPDEALVDADGELAGRLPLKLEVLPAAVSVVA